MRLRVRFADGGVLALHDPRRFGRVSLDPDEDLLGPDAAAITVAGLRHALASPVAGGGPPLKARLLDQSRLAGVGNLLADEILWRASLSPLAPSASLSAPEVRRLHRHLRATLEELAARGGSHTGGPDGGAPPGRPLPAGRRRAGLGHGRRAHHLVVPGPPALKAGALGTHGWRLSEASPGHCRSSRGRQLRACAASGCLVGHSTAVHTVPP